MVQCRIVTTYMFPFDALKYFVAVRSPIDCHEIGSIPYRRQWLGNGSSSVEFSGIENLVAGAC
jgi:hypothetical protein